MKRARRERLDDLQARLNRLRETASWLASHASIGAALRLDLANAGSATWHPAEDLSWRTWVEREGDEYAHDVLVAIDELLEARAAEIEAGDKPEERS